MVLNRFPLWKNLLVIAVLIISFIYAVPMLFGDDPAVQISGTNPTVPMDQATLTQIEKTLGGAGIEPKQFQHEGRNFLLRFTSTDTQLKAKELLQQTLGDSYIVALNLAPATPAWLKAIGASPMKLGLDLLGGVHLLMQVDVDSVLKQRIEGDLNNISQTLRMEHIRYASLSRLGADGVTIQFRTEETLSNALTFVTKRFPEFTWTKNNLNLQGVISPEAVQHARQDTMEQEMNTLRNRVNELGVSEAIVQQQGANRIVVDLPGILDTAQAKDILGKVATLEFHMVDTEHDVRNVVGGASLAESKVYDYQGQPILLRNQIILRGSSIVNADSGFGEDGRPNVNVRLGGSGDALFTKTTAESIGKPMAVLYVEDKSEVKDVNGEKVINYKTERRVISVATIQNTLGNSFQITGLSSQDEARSLALLLRAGALAAPIAFIEERQIGPTLGKQNIDKGVTSVVVGFLLVVIFMALYYRGMGLVADIALAMNLVLIVAVMSLLGATLTLPGIAGIVLNLGMAVDANVLIFERIREELRNGAGVQASIHAGYERAFVTIVDANLTTLIVAVVLFSLGSGAVKSFAVTLTIGVITSMFTAITGTRAIVNAWYGAKTVKKISIGI